MKALIEQQQRELDSLKLSFAAEEEIRATGVGPNTSIVQIDAGSDSGGAPVGPVGEAPPAQPTATLALPPEVSVLTPPGRLVFDNAVEYQGTASNRLVFSGIQIVSGVQIGVLEDSQTRNDTIIGLSTLRYGITDRLEVEATVPFVSRFDRVTSVQTANTQLTTTHLLSGYGPRRHRRYRSLSAEFRT